MAENKNANHVRAQQVLALSQARQGEGDCAVPAALQFVRGRSPHPSAMEGARDEDEGGHPH